MNIPDIQRRIANFAKERDWDQFHTPKNLVMALSVECSELVEIFQWLNEQESQDVMCDATSAERIRHEVADITVYLLRIADKLGIDLERAIDEKMKHNAKKYPAELARGSAKKYYDLKNKS